MVFMGETGHVHGTRSREVNFEWQIPNFLSLSGEVDGYYQSPVFCLSDSCWSLRIYPKGEKETPEWVGLYVERQDSGSPISVRIIIRIPRFHGMAVSFKSDTGKLLRGSPKFVAISDLKNKWHELVPSGVLTVICILETDLPHPTEVSLSTRLWNLRRDLKRMLDEGKGTDFALKLKEGGELRAHKKILDARCGYFAGMLGNDFQENASGVADIDDIEEGVFQFILSYLYTGDGEGISDRNVCKIYVAADKLLLEELKKLCTFYMKEKLGPDLLCDVVVLIEKYDEAELKEHILDYIIKHAKEVFDSDAWKKFSKENCPLVAKFLETFAVWRRP